jgi:predicted phosphodiesterase
LNLPDDYFFNMLRQYRTFKIQGKKFVLSHFFEEEGRIAKTISKRTGLIFDAYQWKSELLEKEKPNYVITGHTHVAHIIKEKNYTLINPGSPTVPRGESKPSYAIG